MASRMKSTSPSLVLWPLDPTRASCAGVFPPLGLPPATPGQSLCRRGSCCQCGLPLPSAPLEVPVRKSSPTLTGAKG